MYRVFEDELGLAIKDAQQTISADLADAGSAKLLGVKVGSPCSPSSASPSARTDGLSSCCAPCTCRNISASASA
ncbi:UTRA domain-containing protein [Bradyrhizobium sp. RDT46]|uniref:UTRA domain-containing protein n=1 Tax=Bradyrhizobium sp. RDT46 TaxID=3341829 RepID=UPI0035C67870